MISNITDSSSENIEEETFMIDNGVYLTNGEPVAAARISEKTDALLLYQAKQNVKDKKNLIKHLVFYVVTWISLGFLFATVINNMTHPHYHSIRNNLNSLQEIAAPYISEDEVRWTVRWLADEVWWAVNQYLGPRYMPNVWYVSLGVMLAWGGWIVVRIVRRGAKSIKAHSTKKGKPDPVMQEYNRLKNSTTDEMM